MRGAVLAGRYAGARYGIHLGFLLLLVVAGGAGYAVQALILLGSLAAHELAHLAVARVLEVGVEEVLLTPLGGVARLDPTLELDPQAEVSIALAGPVQSIGLAGLVYVLAGGRVWDQDLLQFGFAVNANLAFFNLLPALPLDGGRALRGLLAQRYGYGRVTRWMAAAGRLTGAAMGLVAAGALVRGHVLPTPLVAGPYVYWLAGEAREGALYRSMQALLRKRGEVARRRVLPSRPLVATADARLREVLPHMAARHYHVVLVVDEGLAPLATLAESQLLDALARVGPEVTLREILEGP